MEIKSLHKIGFDIISAAFEKAFATYDVQINREELRAMLKRRGFNPNLSFAAFNGNEIVAFTLNGIGQFGGQPTAYDTGTGTISDYRGKGLASKIFEYSLPYLKKAGVRQYLLEVLQHNSKAVSVYTKLGFETVREFNYFNQKNREIDNKIKYSDTFTIKEIGIENLNSVSSFWDFYPSWQNDMESVRRVSDGFVVLGAFAASKLVGYCVFESLSGDITQLAVDKPYRRKGIGSLLLKEMVGLNKAESIKVINTDINCNSITCFLESKNITLKGKQFEMIRMI